MQIFVTREYAVVLMDLDERGTRRWAAAEAMSLGWGGITAVAKAAGLSRSTVQPRMTELKAGQTLDPGRQRRPGGGRRSREVEQPKLQHALERLIEIDSHSELMSQLR
jgi:hypothetical protein